MCTAMFRSSESGASHAPANHHPSGQHHRHRLCLRSNRVHALVVLVALTVALPLASGECTNCARPTTDTLAVPKPNPSQLGHAAAASRRHGTGDADDIYAAAAAAADDDKSTAIGGRVTNSLASDYVASSQKPPNPPPADAVSATPPLGAQTVRRRESGVRDSYAAAAPSASDHINDKLLAAVRLQHGHNMAPASHRKSRRRKSITSSTTPSTSTTTSGSGGAIKKRDVYPGTRPDRPSDDHDDDQTTAASELGAKAGDRRTDGQHKHNHTTSPPPTTDFTPSVRASTTTTTTPLTLDTPSPSPVVSVGRRRRPNDGRRRTVTILGLFELSTAGGRLGRPDGRSELAAARLAVRHINEQRLLPGYRLELVTNDTQCDPGVGVDRFFHALYTQTATRMLMLLGTACSEVTESLAKIVPYWNMVQVSFGSTSPALSDRREFPYFYRTVAPESAHNAARIAFIRRFGWDTVTTFTQNEEIHSLAVNDLVTELERANISCAATITFAATDVRDQLRMLRDLDTRIIIGSFSHDLAAHIFCEAYRLGMYGADYAWILHHDAVAGRPWWWQWWRLRTADCAAAEVAAAAENVLIVASHNRMVDDDGGGGHDGDATAVRSLSGLTNQRFADELRSMATTPATSSPPPPRPTRQSTPDVDDDHQSGQHHHHYHTMSPYAPQTYDAVWSMALALRDSEAAWRRRRPHANASTTTLADFDYSRKDMAGEFLRRLDNLSFTGVSGPVSFSGADRIGVSLFLQIQHGQLQPVALYRPAVERLDFQCPGCAPVRWHSGQVPIAKRVFRLKVTTIAPEAFYAVTSFAALGILFSVGCLAFNLHFRKLKSIKLSSPKLSNIIAVGCICVYAAVILLGMDYSTLPANDKAFSIICTARVYLLSSGFSLAFGSMFAKTYRVHRIFTHSGGGGVCKDKMLRDTQLISLVCALLLLDGLVVTLWVAVDPMQRHLSNLTLEISLTDRSVVYQPQVEVCRSHHTQSWLGALYAYKGLLLVVGVYMAWETRHVKIPALNDSQYIGASVYSVVITSAIVVVLAQLIADRVTLAFITTTALILASTTATLSLLFLPKINGIWGKGAANNDPVIHSMGLKLECNTRRFVTDDRRELQYRVEVQNRVYKKEMAALDAEIAKLQRLLDAQQHLSSTSSLSLSERSSQMIQSLKHQQQLQEIVIVSDCGVGGGGGADRDTMQPSRNLSIGGGLPLLLLSVLPPVIPRASWPTAHPTSSSSAATGPASISYSSQPQLHHHSIGRLPAIDLLNLRLTHQQATADGQRTSGGLFGRLRGLLFTASRTPPERKGSDASVGEISSASTLRKHLGKLTAGLVSASSGGGGHHRQHVRTASCNALHVQHQQQHNHQNGNANGQLAHRARTKSGSALNTLGVTAAAPSPFIVSDEFERSTDERTVLFRLPANRRPSTTVNESQHKFRSRIRGSPRFPHRIVPTTSLMTRGSLGTLNGTAAEIGDPPWADGGLRLKAKCKSMEESSSFTSTSASSASMSSSPSSSPSSPKSVASASVVASSSSSSSSSESSSSPRSVAVSVSMTMDWTAEMAVAADDEADSLSIVSVIGTGVFEEETARTTSQ